MTRPAIHLDFYSDVDQPEKELHALRRSVNEERVAFPLRRSNTINARMIKATERLTDRPLLLSRM